METLRTCTSWALCGAVVYFMVIGLVILGGCSPEPPRTFTAMIASNGMPRTIECIGEPPCLQLPMTIIRQDHPSYDHYMNLVEGLEQ